MYVCISCKSSVLDNHRLCYFHGIYFFIIFGYVKQSPKIFCLCNHLISISPTMCFTWYMCIAIHILLYINYHRKYSLINSLTFLVDLFVENQIPSIYSFFENLITLWCNKILHFRNFELSVYYNALFQNFPVN